MPHKGRGYWQPTRKMRLFGFKLNFLRTKRSRSMGIAEKLNDLWDLRQQPLAPVIIPQVKKWPKGSIGEAFDIYRSTAEWNKKELRTREDWDEPGATSAAPLAIALRPR